MPLTVLVVMETWGLLCVQSMNTVMDDNKMLTLASNERIPLTPSMRLLLEINHMNHCSPATVSRGGVIFVNAEDVGWKPVSPNSSSAVLNLLVGHQLPYSYCMLNKQRAWDFILKPMNSSEPLTSRC